MANTPSVRPRHWARILDLPHRKQFFNGLLGPFEGYDTTATELEYMRPVLGPMAQRLGLKLESRPDIDYLTTFIASRFLNL